jgi:hypothetical protein
MLTIIYPGNLDYGDYLKIVSTGMLVKEGIPRLINIVWGARVEICLPG